MCQDGKQKDKRSVAAVVSSGEPVGDRKIKKCRVKEEEEEEWGEGAPIQKVFWDGNALRE